MRTIIFLALLVTAACSGDSRPEPPADRAFTNGRIYTVDESQPWAEAAVIKDGEFIFVGDNEGAEAFIAEGVEVTDLSGRLVIPGIVDAHTHPGQINLTVYEAKFEADTREGFLAELRAYAEANPGDDWIRGCCWPTQVFVDGGEGPDRKDLDPIYPDRPVYLMSSAGHSFWLNSKALDTLGLDADTPDLKFPVAMYKRDETGRLTGWLKEGAGWQVADEVFVVDRELHESSMREMLDTLSAYGVTALYDAGTKEFADQVYEFIAKLDRAGELPLRYEGTYRISSPDRVPLAVPEMMRYREEYGGERLKFNTVKLFMDGVHENRSGALLEPYADDPDFISDTTLSVEELKNFLIELHAARLDLHVHVIGDLASKRVLDAVEEAKAEVGEDFYPRVSMGHLQNVDPGDWERFGTLDVSANFTPWWLGVDDPDPIGRGLGEARDNDTYRVRAISDAGGNVTFSSDEWELPLLSPYLGMQVGQTRQYPREWLTPENDPDAFRLPESEKLPIELLIKGYTLNGAYQIRMEDRIGSIEVGKAADLVILQDDLFDMDPYIMHKVKPDAVIIDGELIQGSLGN